jgi:DNA-binding transcriptional LysR family regulator
LVRGEWEQEVRCCGLVNDLMEMQQVRYFITLAKTLNFTRAAEECNVSQPSLTRAIRLLEAELGGELVRRERRQSHLTELGQRMLPLLQKCYESALSAKQLATAMRKNEVAPLSIAMSQTINIALFMPQLNELSRAYPGIQLKIRRGAGSEIGQLMKDGEAELAIAGPIGESWERLDRWPLADERFDLVVNREHGLSARDEIAVAELRGERFLRRAGCEMSEEVDRGLAEQDVEAGGSHEVETDQDLLALLESNFGIAVSPASGPFSEKLVRKPIKGLDVVRKITLYGIAGRRRSPAATALLNLLRSVDWSQAIR